MWYLGFFIVRIHCDTNRSVRGEFHSALNVGTQAVLVHHLDMREFPFVPYPPLERLGVIGGGRTAALVAPDGTICWMCLANYDGRIIFGALLDAAKGGVSLARERPSSVMLVGMFTVGTFPNRYLMVQTNRGFSTRCFACLYLFVRI